MRRASICAVLVLGTVAAFAGAGGATARTRTVRILGSWYRAHDGARRDLYLELPSWYGRRDDPSIPLVIAPHGRGVPALSSLRPWGDLPAEGRFAVVAPEGQGRRLRLYSWGAPGQIADLARMPQIVRRRFPWLHIDPSRIYAIGGSMGGQETLLLLARHPRLLAGAISFDGVANFARQYRDFPLLRCDATCAERYREPLGETMQQFARVEVGGSPATDPEAYRARSPLAFARAIARAKVPLELWWSRSDLVVRGQQQYQSGAFFRRLRALAPGGPWASFVGYWRHSHEQRASSRLPFALALIGLLPCSDATVSHALRISPLPRSVLGSSVCDRFRTWFATRATRERQLQRGPR